MFDAIAPRYDLVNRIMTFRMDVGWRRRTVRALGLARRGDASLDLACGTGDLCRELAARPATRRVDLSFGMLAGRAHRRPPSCRATRCACRCRDGSVDGATCGFALRNFESLPPFFAELARVVRPAAAGSRCSRSPSPRTACSAWGHGDVLRQGGPARRRPALRPRRLPLPAPLGRLPPRARPPCSTSSRAAGFVDVDRSCCRWASPS